MTAPCFETNSPPRARWSSAPGKSFVPFLGKPRIPDAELLRVLPPRCGRGAVHRSGDVEGGIENYYTQVQASLPPAALAGLNLHSTLPWNFSAQTQVLALGNANLDVEKVRDGSWATREALSDKAYVTADFYINKLENFVTDLLPGVNPAYPTFAANRWRLNIPADLTALDQRIQAAPSWGTDHAGAGGSTPRADSRTSGRDMPECRPAPHCKGPTRWRLCRTGLVRWCCLTPMRGE